MRVHKDTVFELSMMPWELEPPRTTLMVVVKATFAMPVEGGPCTIADSQVPCMGEVPWDDGDPPSLKSETDYAVIKPHAEWYLVGTAHSGPTPATLVPVTVRVGDMRKQIVVWGERAWRRGILGSKPTEPVPFTSMPLRWERSFGGPGVPENPIGRGIAAVETDQGIFVPMANIEDPRRPVLSREDRPPPAGMFPIPSTWRTRTSLTGTYDAVWKASRWPYFPRDFDFVFFNCAPPDQRREGFWRGDEEIELHGVHPEGRAVRTRLPGLRARVFVEWVTPRPKDAPPLENLSRAELEALGPPKLTDVPLKLDTIVLDTDMGHALCTWRGLVEVADNALSNVARFFVVHEPIDADHPHSHYEAWLLRKLCEEADEFDVDLAAPPALTAETPDLAGAADAPPSPDLGPADVAAAAARFEKDMLAFLETLSEANPDALPSHDAAREKYAELGADPDEVLPLPEVQEVPELEEPPSLLRLAAIIRRRLKKPFRDLDLSDAPYARLDLSGVDFTGSVLTGASLERACIANAVFDGATLTRADLTDADAREASFRDADLSELRAAGANFGLATLDGASGSHAVLTAACLRGASLIGVELEECDLSRCDVREAKLDGADLTGSTLSEANFTNSSMLDTSLESVRAASALFERCSMADLRASDGADFTGANFVLVDAPRAQFQGATLVGGNLSGSNLESADFTEANGHRINLVKCVLKKACFDKANLTEAMLLGADLAEASLSEADLGRADARGAHFFSANLWRARTHGAILEGAILDRTLLGSR